MTFEEYSQLPSDCWCELVSGDLVPLAGGDPRHGWTKGALIAELGGWARAHAPAAFCGPSVSIQLGPVDGLCPDLSYWGPASAAECLDWVNDRVLGLPDLVIEVVSPGAEHRDWVEKRQAYAEAGIPHYWIFDPTTATVTTMHHRSAEYQVGDRLSGDQELTSPLMPGLRIPVDRLLNPRRKRLSEELD